MTHLYPLGINRCKTTHLSPLGFSRGDVMLDFVYDINKTRDNKAKV